MATAAVSLPNGHVKEYSTTGIWSWLTTVDHKRIGARDVAFPRLNAFSYWVYLFGSLFMNFSWLLKQAPDGGWFGYAPLTTLQFNPGLDIDFWMLGLQILGVSSLAAAFNFITTIINMRAPGMNLMRMPIFKWLS